MSNEVADPNALHASLRSKLAALPGVEVGPWSWTETAQYSLVCVNGVRIGRVFVERAAGARLALTLGGVASAPDRSLVPGTVTATGIVRALRGR